jgi:hypothetical protein
VACVCWSVREISRDAADGSALTGPRTCRRIRFMASRHVRDAWGNTIVPLRPPWTEIESSDAFPRARGHAC